MTLLMVTPYPPYRDGIGTYAAQEIRRLRADGAEVEVLSPVPSAAHHHLALGNSRGIAALAKKVRAYDSTIIQFSPEMFFGSCRGPVERVAVWAGLAAVARLTRLEIRLHEIQFGPLARNPVERTAARRALMAAAVISVHTQPEVERLAKALNLSPESISLVAHGQNFVAATTETQEAARAELKVDLDRHQFVAIGFLQEHKGFDLAVEAFRNAGLSDTAELHVVGSVRVNHPDLTSYARSLDRLCRATEGVRLHQRYVSDEEFDRWIIAADTVVLPYREIWSSSVLERAKLLERPIIAADVGGLADQAPAGTMFFDDIESLAQCLKERASTTQDREALAADGTRRPLGLASQANKPATGSAWRFDAAGPDRVSLEAQIRERALAGRGMAGMGAGAQSARLGSLEPLLAVPALYRPEPVSARRGVTSTKRLLRRLLNWEIGPLAAKLEHLHRATTEAVARLEAGGAAVSDTDRGLYRGRWLIEDPFVHGAVAELHRGASILLVSGHSTGLPRTMVALGHRVTMVDPCDPILSDPEGELGPDEGFDAVIVLSAAMAASESVAGWLALASRLLTSTGRAVIAVDYGAATSSTAAAHDRASLGLLLAGWTVGDLRVGVEGPSGEWRLEADELLDGTDQPLLALMVLTSAG